MFDGLVAQARFLVDPRRGALIVPLEPRAFDADGVTIVAPDEQQPAIQLRVEPERVDPAWDEGCDRWRAAHGEELPGRIFAVAPIESVKTEAGVVDGDSLGLINPLLPAEGASLKRLNGDGARFRCLCETVLSREFEAPVAIGIDPDGVSVRTRFGVARLPFDPPVHAPEALESAVDLLLARIGSPREEIG